MKAVEFTQLEEKFLKAFEILREEEMDMEEFGLDTLSYSAQMSIPSLKGVIGSLVKKGIIETFQGDFVQMVRFIG